MKWLSYEITFDKITLTDYESGTGYGSYGSGGCKYQEVFHRKIKTIRFLGLRLISYVLEWEHIPSHVWISMGCLGYSSSDWKSKWSDESGFYGNIVKYKSPLMFDRPNLSIY